MILDNQLAKLSDLIFYTVIDEDGKFLSTDLFFCSDTDRIKIYRKIGPARALITREIKYSKGKYVPYLVEISNGKAIILDDKDRTDKIIEKVKRNPYY